MIQRTNSRRTSTAATASDKASSSDVPEIWGQWCGRKYYSLEVVQHPLRARMCGFGDKDRRPLAPAAVAKMVVRNQDNSLVDIDEIDWSFFLVTVDLWSADAKQEMNLVLHPSSGDRYIPTASNKNRRRGASVSQQQQQQQRSGSPTPIPATPAPAYRSAEQSQIPASPLPAYTSQQTHQGYFAAVSADNNYPTVTAYVQQDNADPPWGYNPQNTGVDRTTTYPPPILPSIHTFTAASSDTAPWNSYPTVDNGGSRPHDHDPNMQYNVNQTYPQRTQHQAIQISPANSQQSGYAPPYIAPAAPEPTSSTNKEGNQEKAAATYPPLDYPRLTYTRTLVGPLSANACRLEDEHRKFGIFFLFQDLSVRTEGTFRLRMRLMNVGAPPAPEWGAAKVHTDISPVLAQTFTKPFTVFSAKRFPGVPDTTPLSIAFGNQGQKLPLRNRHGSAKRPRQNSMSSGGEDSDDVE